MSADLSPNPYAYTDYRSLVQDWLAGRRTMGRKLSNAWLARQLGVGESMVRAVLDGDKDLLPERVPLLATALGYAGDEAEYLSLLVRRNQEDALALDPLLDALRHQHGVVPAGAGLFQAWYLLPILELSDSAEFDEDPAWIAAALGHGVTAAQAAGGLAMLIADGHLVRGEDGRLRRAEGVVRTDEPVLRRSYFDYALDLLRLGRDGLAQDHALVEAGFLQVGQEELANATALIEEAYEDIGRILAQHPSVGPSSMLQVAFGAAIVARSAPSDAGQASKVEG